MSKDRAQDWGANDAFGDGYLEKTAADKRGYESDPSDTLDRNLQQALLSNPFSQGDKWFRKRINRTEGKPYFKPLGGKPLSDTKHTVTLDNGLVLRKSDLAFNKNQPSAPSKFSAVPNSINNSHDLAVSRATKGNSPLKRPDSNEGGPSTSYKPTGEKAMKRRRIKTLSFKGSNFAFTELDSSLELDHWDKVIDDYLGTDSEIVYNTPTFKIDSDLDQSRHTLTSETNTQRTSILRTGTGDNPIRIDSSPKTPKSNKPRPRRNPGPPKFYGDRRFS